MLMHSFSKPVDKKNRLCQSSLSVKYTLAIYSVRWKLTGTIIHNALKSYFSASPKTSAEVFTDTLK